MQKPAFGVSDQVRHIPDYAAIEDGYRLENRCSKSFQESRVFFRHYAADCMPSF